MALKQMSKMSMESYTDNTAIMSLSLPYIEGPGKPMNLMFGKIDLKNTGMKSEKDKPYFGITKPEGVCSIKDQKIGPFHLNECKHNEVTSSERSGIYVRAEFKDKSQLILRCRMKAYKGFDMVDPIGLSLGKYTDDTTAGFFLAGDKNIPVIFMGNTKMQRPLKGFEDGTRKIKKINFDESTRVIEIIDMDDRKVRL
jgi:hypothetical protein